MESKISRVYNEFSKHFDEVVVRLEDKILTVEGNIPLHGGVFYKMKTELCIHRLMNTAHYLAESISRELNYASEYIRHSTIPKAEDVEYKKPTIFAGGPKWEDLGCNKNPTLSILQDRLKTAEQEERYEDCGEILKTIKGL